MSKWCWLIVLVIGPAWVGCGGDRLRRVSIEGVLTAAGSPVDGATVQFIPAAGTAGEGGIGQTNAEGKFTLISSRKGDKGIPPGKYTVRVSRLMDGDGTILPPDAKEADYPNSKESIPQPYSGVSSPLQATISDTGGEVKLDIPQKISGKRKS